MKLIIISLFALTACNYEPPLAPAKKLYQLSDGSMIACGIHYISECGMTLYQCDDGIEYKCQTNVKVLP